MQALLKCGADQWNGCSGEMMMWVIICIVLCGLSAVGALVFSDKKQEPYKDETRPIVAEEPDSIREIPKIESTE